MKIFRRIVVVLVIAVVVAAGYWYLQNRNATQAAAQSSSNLTQIVAVQQGDLTASISVVGQLYAPQNQVMTFDRLSGTTSLATLDVQAGSVVKAGQQLATVDPSPYQQALDQAQSDLKSAQQTLTDLQTPPTELEIAQADLAVAQARVTLQTDQSNLDAIVKPDLASLQDAVTNAQISLAQAQSSLAAAQPNQTTADRLATLQQTEDDLWATYSGLASETYSDQFYQDRLLMAKNAFLTAQDSRMTQELNSQISLLNAQMQVLDAKNTLATARKDLATAKAGGDPLTLAQAEQAVAKDQSDLASAQDTRAKLDEGPDAATLAADQAAVSKAQQAVTTTQTDLAGATLVAPFDGTILETDVVPGDRITAAATILTIANLNQLQVIASIDETTIRQVSVGQAATITFDAFPGESFQGQVLSVPFQGTLQGGVMVYDVPVSLEGANNLPLLVGMTANIAVSTGQVQNALVVPTIALQNINGLYQVLVPSNDPTGAPTAVPVEIGLSNGTYTQITKGLNPGDQVVVQLSAAQSNQFNFGALRALEGGGGPPQGQSRQRNGG